MTVIRPSLSKVRHQYFTFLTGYRSLHWLGRGQWRITMRTESLPQALRLDVFVDALRDLSETHKRAPRVCSQHGKHIIDNDAWLSQRIPLAHRDLPRRAYRR